jgi:hypothetical protein
MTEREENVKKIEEREKSIQNLRKGREQQKVRQ